MEDHHRQIYAPVSSARLSKYGYQPVVFTPHLANVKLKFREYCAPNRVCKTKNIPVYKTKIVGSHKTDAQKGKIAIVSACKFEGASEGKRRKRGRKKGEKKKGKRGRNFSLCLIFNSENDEQSASPLHSSDEANYTTYCALATFCGVCDTYLFSYYGHGHIECVSLRSNRLVDTIEFMP